MVHYCVDPLTAPLITLGSPMFLDPGPELFAEASRQVLTFLHRGIEEAEEALNPSSSMEDLPSAWDRL